MAEASVDEFSARIRDHGWALIDLPDPSPAGQGREALLGELRRLTGDDGITLETYHEVVTDDGRHIDLQFALCTFWRDHRLGQAIFEKQLAFFCSFFGPDIHVQRKPYLRIARPGKSQDNIGYHRDTAYGCSGYELSMVTALVDLSAEAALAVLPGSHLRPDSDFPFEQEKVSGVHRGTKKREMGFLYDRKICEPWFENDLVAVEMRVGQALLFSTATMHGQSVNRASYTRWTTDFCAVSTAAPLDLAHRAAFYEPLCRSATTDIGNRFAAAGRA